MTTLNITNKMGNQQRNSNKIYIGNTIKEIHSKTLIKKYKNNSSLSSLSKEYGYNVATIRYFLKKNNIIIRNVKESVVCFHKKSRIVFDKKLEENLIGWLLGDGGMRLAKKAINPYLTYTDKKYSHIKYVNDILNLYGIKTNINLSKKSLCYQLQTECLPEFHKYYDLFYGYEGLNENGEKRKILPDVTLTPIILRNWYIGDGSSCIQKGCLNNKGQISCKYKNENILKQLNNICGIVKCYEYSTKKGKCHQYYFNNTSLSLLLGYIGECPVEEYKYKWITRRSTTIIKPTLSEVEGIV